MPAITLQWDPMPAGEAWTQVRIYEGTTQVGSAIPPATSVNLTITRGAHTYVARSWDGVMESDDSNTVTVRVPGPPGQLRKS